ncbi:MAG: hypothetical protein B7Z03_13300 [Hydrogenophilales bacterium 32-62-9]|nr:MAG: hypothetical protein B7Z03_13300 [Hydrogenophilales bacterium 32-62-9]
MRWRHPMKVEVRVPMLSDSVASGTLLPWRKQVGERVARDEALVDLETDKVILEIPAPASGTLLELRQPEGAVVKADEVVAVIETGDESMVPGPSVQPVAAARPASPVLPTVAVKAPIAQTPVPAAVPAASVLLPATQQMIQPGESRREPMSRLRSRVAERLVAAQHSAAMLTTFNEVNMQAVNELRQRYKGEFEARYGVKLGYMSFFVRAVCQALGQFPIVNAAIDGQGLGKMALE